MSMNKKILAVAIVGTLFAGAANAAVDFNAPNAPVKYSNEMKIDGTAGTVLTNSAAGAAGNLTLKGTFNYAFSQGEVRYARVSCTNGMRFDSASVTSNNPNAVIGSVNGIGDASGAIYFSVTAQGGNIAAGDEFYVDGDRVVFSNSDNACSYELYDTPSQAAQGGASGRITSATTSYLDFVDSYTMTVNAGTGGVANVEANPAYTNFFVNSTTSQNFVDLGDITTKLTSATIYETDGSVLLFPEIIGGGSKHIVDGDFTFAASAGATPYDAAAKGRVFLDVDSSGCAAPNGGDVLANTLTATRATFNTGSAPLNSANLCVVAEGSSAIGEGGYTVTWDVVTADAAKYTTPDIGPLNLGSITRNGTQLQAPMINLPQGYVSRVALTNTGNQARPFILRALPYEGAPITTATATYNGSIPANGGTVVELKDFITAFGGTGATRAVIIVTVNAPNNQIQGQYQIVRPDSGAISNFVMVRPGTN
jgi:hypothetical protein